MRKSAFGRRLERITKPLSGSIGIVPMCPDVDKHSVLLLSIYTKLE
jgi:hypothetical protein